MGKGNRSSQRWTQRKAVVTWAGQEAEPWSAARQESWAHNWWDHGTRQGSTQYWTGRETEMFILYILKLFPRKFKCTLLTESSFPGGFPSGSEGRESTCNTGAPGSIPGSEDPLEKEMATHSSILAWRIPRTEEPGGLQSMGLQRVRHDWNSPVRFTDSYQKQIQIPPGEKPPLYKLPGYPGLKSTNVSLQSKINKYWGKKITLK